MHIGRVLSATTLASTLGLALACGYTPPEPVDEDGDGWTDDDDCNDDNASIRPGAPERCNGRDDDCDGDVDEEATDGTRYYDDWDDDGYGDPYGTTTSCDRPSGYVTNGDDCDDASALSYPGADEVCDGEDNDCDGAVDEDVESAATWYVDADGDGYGEPSGTTEACEAPAGYVADATDCDDADGDVHPGTFEACGNGVDDDCRPTTPDNCSYALLDLATADAALLPRGKSERVGTAVAGPGDVDDDGYDDLLIGGPSTGTVADGAYLVLGPVTGWFGLSGADGHLEADETGVGAGAAVGGGDLNDDGYGDLVYAAPEASTSAGVAAGAVLLRYGPDAVGCEPYCEGATFYGTSAGDGFGTALAVGDVHRDGMADLLVGAPYAGTAGAVYLFESTLTGVVHAADADATLAGESGGATAGADVAIGDLDDDGRGDLVVLDEDAGIVYVVASPASGAVELSAAYVRLDGDEDRLPGDVAAAADLDDDGADDLVVGLTADGVAATEVAAYVFYGPLAGTLAWEDAGTRLTGDHVYANLGAHVAVGGDFDRDGADDLIVGAPFAEVLAAPDFAVVEEYRGSVFVLHGPLATGDLSLGDATTRLWSEEPRDLRDLAIAFGGDVDGDGRSDLLLGAWRNASTATNGGIVWVVGGDRL